MKTAKLEALWNKVQKPAQYIGGELGSIVKNQEEILVNFALGFPEIYEIGMSHLGMKILYGLLNQQEDVWCQRVFAPEKDMEDLMREKKIPLYGLDGLTPITNFDFIGFTLPYEMSYTGVLNMLDLAQVPLYQKDRSGLSPLIIGGGPCTCNPEPMADFFDLFVLGEGEEVTLELVELYKTAKLKDWTRKDFLSKASSIQGVYVPSLYKVTYNSDGTVDEIAPLDNAPKQVLKRIVEDLDSVYFPEQVVVPYIRVVHDRTMLEVLRGCIHGCRFCQAGFIYRPYREKSSEVLEKNAKALTENTGYDEISLTSLSTSDHSELSPLLEKLLTWTEEDKISISLPSLRIDSISPELLEQISTVRRSGLTFAPEAGTQRMRDVINKNITEEDIMKTCTQAFSQGYTSVKLYFMMGLPTETMEDIKGIADLTQKVVDLYYNMGERPTIGRPVNVTISTACFVPKPFTPFQFDPQDTMEEFYEKQKYLKSCIESSKISYRYHDSPTSVLEAVLARGDRRLSGAIYKAWEKGSFLDGWSEHFDNDRWVDAFSEADINPAFYANRKRSYNEVFPWSHLDYSISHKFLVKEHEKAVAGITTENCRDHCHGCGAASLYPKGERRLPCL